MTKNKIYIRHEQRVFSIVELRFEVLNSSTINAWKLLIKAFNNKSTEAPFLISLMFSHKCFRCQTTHCSGDS